MDTISRRLAAEFIGTAMLLATVVGSGIMAERLSGGNVAIALLANTFATGAALVALIFTFGPISGAHFNPAVTLWASFGREIDRTDAVLYLAAQISGAILGVGAANLMFDLPFLFASTKPRSGWSQWLGEFIATFGLIGVIHSSSRFHRALVVPIVVASYISAAYWFTSSTSFANPVVTIARSLSDTFAGIKPVDAPGFIIAQLLGAVAAIFVFRWLVPEERMSNKKRVLILCTGNSARSQMAEGLLRNMAGGRFEVQSAGVAPSYVRPEAIAAMADIGIDISASRSKSVDEFAGEAFDHVITVCDNAKEHCPVFPGRTRRIHWGFDDPAAVEGTMEDRLNVFRRVRDEIADKLRSFVKDEK